MTEHNFTQADRTYEQQLPDDDCDTDWDDNKEPVDCKVWWGSMQKLSADSTRDKGSYAYQVGAASFIAQLADNQKQKG